MSQFTDDFREFICQLCHTWITGCKPTPRTFDRWNLSKLDPAGIFLIFLFILLIIYIYR